MGNLYAMNIKCIRLLLMTLDVNLQKIIMYVTRQKTLKFLEVNEESIKTKLKKENLPPSKKKKKSICIKL